MQGHAMGPARPTPNRTGGHLTLSRTRAADPDRSGPDPLPDAETPAPRLQAQGLLSKVTSSPSRGVRGSGSGSVIASVSRGVPAGLTEVTTRGRTLSAPRTRWPTSPVPASATARRRRLADASNTYAAPPSGSATSPTTSPAACTRPAASGPDYTPNCDEPVSVSRRRWRVYLTTLGRARSNRSGSSATRSSSKADQPSRATNRASLDKIGTSQTMTVAGSVPL